MPVAPHNVVPAVSTLVFEALGVNDSFRPNDRARYELRVEGSTVTITATVEQSKLGAGSTLAEADRDRSWNVVQRATFSGRVRHDGSVRILELAGDGGPIVYRCQDEAVDAADPLAILGGTRMPGPDCASANIPSHPPEHRVMALMCRLDRAPLGVGIELGSQKDRGGGWLAFGSPGIEYVMQAIDCAGETYGYRVMP